MKKLLIILLLMVSTLLGEDPYSTGDRNVDTIVKEANGLAFQLFSLLKQGKDNFVFSPYGVSESMALPFAGSDGYTQSQTARILRYRMDQPQALAAFSWLNERYANSPYFLSTSLWVLKGIFKPSFKEAIEKGYKSALRSADFITRPEIVRTEMNSWIRERTQGKLTDIVPQKELTFDTRIVVLSAAYMKGRWQLPFDIRETRQAAFFSDKFTTSTVSTMHALGEYNYFNSDKFSVIELPYEGLKGSSSMSLIVFLPHDTYGLKKIEADFSLTQLNEALGTLQKKLIALSLPRFRLISDTSIANALIKIGLTDAFKDGANFTDIRDVGDLKISAVLQKVLYSVDEGGSDSGLGSISTEKNSQVQVATTVSVNHPFLFVIVDREINAVLMMGRLSTL